MPSNIRIIASASADNSVEDSVHSLRNYDEILVLQQRGIALIQHSRMIVKELKLHYPQAMAMLKALDTNEQIETNGPDDKSDNGSFVSASENFPFMNGVIPEWTTPTVHEKETQTLNAGCEKALLEKESQTAPEFSTSIVSNSLISHSSIETNCPESPAMSSHENSFVPTSQYIRDDKPGMPSLWNRTSRILEGVLNRASTVRMFLTRNLQKEQSFPFSTMKNMVNHLLYITPVRKEEEESFRVSQDTLKTCASTSDWSSPWSFMKNGIELLFTSLDLAREHTSLQLHPATILPSHVQEKNTKLEAQNESALEIGRNPSIQFTTISNAKSICVKVALKTVRSGQHLVSRLVPAKFAKPISRWINSSCPNVSHTPSPLQQSFGLALKEAMHTEVLTFVEASSDSKGASSPPSIASTQIHPTHDFTEKEQVQENEAKPHTQLSHFIVSMFVPALFLKPISRWIPSNPAFSTLPSNLQQVSSLTLNEEMQAPVLSCAAKSTNSEGDSQMAATSDAQIHSMHDSTEKKNMEASVTKPNTQYFHLFPQDDELARRYFERRAYLNEKVGIVRRSYRRMKHIAICGYHIQELLEEYGIIETVCTMAFD